MRKMTFLLACCLMAVTAWATNPLETDCGDNVQITASPTEGYHFVKWQKGGADFVGNDVNPLTISSVDASATYRAFFAINGITTSSSIMTIANWMQAPSSMVRHRSTTVLLLPPSLLPRSIITPSPAGVRTSVL